LAGDTVLAWTANRLGMTKRGADVVGRIGGEEFLAILPELGRAGAVSAVERLRAAVGAITLDRDGATLNATLSAGLAVFPDDGGDWDRLFSAADRRLYAAKRQGRDRLVAEDPPGA
jgi:diguanylate cyclase (GGDEF)-like protein